MAGNAAEFLIRLNDQVSGPARAAAGALQQVEAAATASVGPLRDASGKFLKIGSDAYNAAAKMIQAGASAKEAAAAVSGGSSAAGAAAASASTGMDQLADKIGGMATASTGAGGAIGKLQSMLKLLGPQAQGVAMAIGVATIAATALFGAIGAGMSLAISAAEKFGKLRAQFDALAGGSAAGGKVLDMVSRLGQALPFATSQVREWAKGLLAAGLEGRRLESAVRAVAAAEAFGEGGAAAAEKLFKTLAEGGQGAAQMLKKLQAGGRMTNAELAEMGIKTADIARALGMSEKQFKAAHLTAAQMSDAIAKAVTTKNAGALGAMMNSWPNIIGKAREGLNSIFGGMGPQVEKFMASVSKLFSVFNKGGFAIQVLKPIAASVFGTLFTWATKALDIAYQGMIRLAIWGVKAYIMAHPLVGAFREMWAAVVKFGGALAALFPAGPKLNLLAIAGLAIRGAFQGAIAIILGLAKVVTFVANIGTNISTALAKGITSGGGAVVAAIKGLASSALGAFTSAFRIRSPSRIMVEHGEDNIAGALAGGVDKGAPKVAASMGKLGGKPGGGGAKGQGAGSGGDYFDFRGAHFGGDLTEEKLETWLVRILQKARRSGAEMEPAPGVT